MSSTSTVMKKNHGCLAPCRIRLSVVICLIKCCCVHGSKSDSCAHSGKSDSLNVSQSGQMFGDL